MYTFTCPFFPRPSSAPCIPLSIHFFHSHCFNNLFVYLYLYIKSFILLWWALDYCGSPWILYCRASAVEGEFSLERFGVFAVEFSISLLFCLPRFFSIHLSISFAPFFSFFFFTSLFLPRTYSRYLFLFAVELPAVED